MAIKQVKNSKVQPKHLSKAQEKQTSTEPRPTSHLTRQDKFLNYVGIAILLFFFFIIAFSEITNTVKAPLLLVDLLASSVLIAKLTDAQNYYGLLIIRGTKGFNLMKYVADHHPRLSTMLVDLGLSLGFGAFYSFYLFRREPKKFLVHLVALVLLFVGMGFSSGNQNALVMQVLGIFFGLAGVGVASVALNAFTIATVPGTPAGVMPVIPGLTVPFEAIFAIIIIAIIHETAHGVMFFVNKLKVVHSGALLFGFIPVGAFVEPDEAEFNKTDLQTKRRVLVAGSASNFYAMLIFAPLATAFLFAAGGLASGVTVASIAKDAPAAGILSVGDVIEKVNGVTIHNTGEFIAELQKLNSANSVDSFGPKPAELTLQTGEVKQIVPVSGKIGIQAANFVTHSNGFLYGIVAFLAEVLRWTVLLNLALAVVNLLPLFITDGHKIIQEEIANALGKKNEKNAMLLSNVLGVIVLLLILFNMVPIFK